MASQVDDQSSTTGVRLGTDGELCSGELLTAVALRRAERVAGEALAVQPNEHGLRDPRLDVASDQRHVLVPVARSVGHDPELADVGRKSGVTDAFDADGFVPGTNLTHAGTRP